MASTQTDEDLFTAYHAATGDAAKADAMVKAHRERYPEAMIDASGDWAGVSADDRVAAVLAAIKRAATMSDGPERDALLDHACGGMRAEAAPKAAKRAAKK